MSIDREVIEALMEYVEACAEAAAHAATHRDLRYIREYPEVRRAGECVRFLLADECRRSATRESSAGKEYQRRP